MMAERERDREHEVGPTLDPHSNLHGNLGIMMGFECSHVGLGESTQLRTLLSTKQILKVYNTWPAVEPSQLAIWAQ